MFGCDFLSMFLDDHKDYKWKLTFSILSYTTAPLLHPWPLPSRLVCTDAFPSSFSAVSAWIRSPTASRHSACCLAISSFILSKLGQAGRGVWGAILVLPLSPIACLVLGLQRGSTQRNFSVFKCTPVETGYLCCFPHWIDLKALFAN